MDNDSEFLIKVAEGILELKQFCKNSAEISALINPLKILASLDQPPVRDQAIACLKKLAIAQNKCTSISIQSSTRSTTTHSLKL
jgi:hypothetical protein